MFAPARFVVRHKVGATAILEDAQQSSSPWALNAAPSQASTTQDAGLIDGVVDTAVSTAVTYLDEAGMNPMAEAEETVDRFDQTAAAMGEANDRN